MEPRTSIRCSRQCPAHSCNGGAGRGLNERMSCIILGLTKLFRLNQVENNQNGSRLHSRAHICGIRQTTFTNILLRCGLINAIHGNNQLYPWFTPSYQHFLLILQACSVQAVCCERWNHQGSQISTVVANYLIRMLYRIKLGYLCQIWAEMFALMRQWEKDVIWSWNEIHTMSACMVHSLYNQIYRLCKCQVGNNIQLLLLERKQVRTPLNN